MTNYIELARNIANERKTREAERLEHERKERESRDRLVNDVMACLKRQLQQWNEVGFTVKDEGNHHHVDCVSLWRDKEKLLGFQCYYGKRDQEDESWESAIIKVTFFKEEMERFPYGRAGKTARVEHHKHAACIAGDLVDECMKSVANYLSRFF